MRAQTRITSLRMLGAKVVLRRSMLKACSLPGMLFFCAIGNDAQTMPVRAPAQIRPRPLLVLTGTLSVTVAPTSLMMTLSPQAVSTASSSIVITSTASDLTGTGIVFGLYGYFSSTTAALTNTTSPTYTIPPSAIQGLVSGTGATATSYTSFSQTTPFSGASGLQFSSLSGGLLNLLTSGSIMNNLTLEINLSTLPQLPAGTYNGTLNIAAQAM